MDIPYLLCSADSIPFSSIFSSFLIVKLYEPIATLTSGEGLRTGRMKYNDVLKGIVLEPDLLNFYLYILYSIWHIIGTQYCFEE